jgi:hypothetical protein
MPGRDSDTARRQQLTTHPGLGGLLLNFLAAAVGLGVVLGVVAFAVSVPDSGAARPASTAWQELLPVQARPATVGGPRAPRIVAHPEAASTSTDATFDFTEPTGAGPLSCRLDDDAWSACSSPVTLGGLGAGVHDFLVRGAGPAAGRRAMSFMRWSVVVPARFTIAPTLDDLGNLYPGAAPIVLPLRVTNPNRAPIAVTKLKVSIPVSPHNCSAGRNLELIPSNASATRPLRIRAGASVWLPGRGISAPSIRMRNRPINQDACQRARFRLAFTGTAHG